MKKMKLHCIADKELLEAVVEAMKLGIIDPILIGNMEKIEDMLKKFGLISKNLILLMKRIWEKLQK